MVMQHAFPYAENPVVVLAIVVTDACALPTLTAVFRSFVHCNRGHMRSVRVGTAVCTVLHTDNGISVTDVEQALLAATTIVNEH